MSLKDYICLGINHHLLYADMIRNPSEHLRTLKILLADVRWEIIDMWYPWEIQEETLKAIRDSGKTIYYNIGNRSGQRSLAPASMDDELRRYTFNVYLDELKRAKMCNAQKIITNSGPNVLEHREKCKDYLVAFYIELCKQAETIMVIIEPTDWDTSKYKLIGSSLEAVEICQRVKNSGYRNIGSMIDMCHVPLMHETISKAFSDTSNYLEHIHLGNCVLDKRSPYYGDKHPGIGIGGGIFGVSDIAELFGLGLSSRYFCRGNRGSASIEMRVLPGLSAEECLDSYYNAVCQAWHKASMNQ